MERIGMREKILSLNEAAGWVRDGFTLGLMGPPLEDEPMSFLHEVVRQGTRNLQVVNLPGGGLGIDFLIGAGAVSEYETSFCSLGEYGPAPHFQKGVRLHSFKLKENT
jgi:glutaconate CoA-transferase, subunit A